MTIDIYGPKQIADSFRRVRANTITIAVDIPEEKYGFRPMPEVKSVAEQLAHIAVATTWQIEVHRDRVSHIDYAMFGASIARAASEEQALSSKDAIVAALRDRGEQFAAFLDRLDHELAAETVTFPAQVQPSIRTRFEMLLAAKEHEIHHRAQLMVYERMLGIVPHLTRRRAAGAAAVASASASAASARS
jgi:uncharacterized damage-inducible protein DinB